MMNILVTGSHGQLGSEIKEIASHYPAFTFHFHDIDTLDITIVEAVSTFIKNNHIHYIINCASYTQVDKAETESELAFKINAEGPETLAKLANQYSSLLIHISTDFVFDGRKKTPYKEDDKPNPLSVYGKSKQAGEERVLQYNDNLIIRTSWLYSSYGNNFVKKIIQLSHQEETIRVVNDQVGSPTYAADLAKAILEILVAVSNGEHSLKPGIYHYSNEGFCTWYDLAAAIVEMTNRNCSVVPIKTEEYPLPATRPEYSVMNKDKIKTNYRIQIPGWRESLTTCMKKIQ